MAFTSFAADGATVPSPPANGGTAPGFLLELLVADLQWTSVQIAMLGLTASVCAGSDSRMNLRALRHIVQSDASVMQLALRYAANIGLAREQALTLNQLYAELSATAKQIAPLVDVVALLPQTARAIAASAAGPAPARGDGGGGARLAGAGDARASERQLSPRRRGHPPISRARRARRSGRGRTARRHRAAGSDAASAEPARPRQHALPARRRRRGDRRRDRRRFAHRSRPQRSRQGADFAPADAVVVQVGERRLEAEVARRSGERVGLKLKRPIALSDPLYRAD